MGLSPGRAGTTVANSSEVVQALGSNLGHHLLQRHAVREFADGGGDSIEHPVGPDSSRCVTVIHDEGKALGAARRGGPAQRGKGGLRSLKAISSPPHPPGYLAFSRYPQSFLALRGIVWVIWGRF